MGLKRHHLLTSGTTPLLPCQPGQATSHRHGGVRVPVGRQPRDCPGHAGRRAPPAVRVSGWPYPQRKSSPVVTETSLQTHLIQTRNKTEKQPSLLLLHAETADSTAASPGGDPGDWRAKARHEKFFGMVWQARGQPGSAPTPVPQCSWGMCWGKNRPWLVFFCC